MQIATSPLRLTFIVVMISSFLTAFGQADNAVTPLKMPEQLKGRTLPVEVDNSKSPWFPPVYSQIWFPNCQQASGVYHAFTYALNRARHDTVNTSDHIMATNFTYNYYDGESQDGVSFLHSYQLIKEAGNPTVTDFGYDHVVGGLYWMSGYDKYYRAMHNRIDQVVSIPVNTLDGLNMMRNWLFDHLDDSEWGGVAVFGAHAPYSIEFLPPESPYAGYLVMPRIVTSPSHGMTIVGYNDSIRFDVNNDGRFTNDTDINNDGRIDLGDWEIGGYKIANSYGEQWGNDGFFFLLYSAFAQGIGNWGAPNECAYAVTVKEDYKPLLTAKFKLSHNLRNRLSIKIGMATDTSRAYPETIREFQIFNYLGQAHKLSGNDSILNGEQLEAGLDLTPMLSATNPDAPFKIFLIADQRDLSDGQAHGIIHNFSVFAGDQEFISNVDDLVIDGIARTLVPVVVDPVAGNRPVITTQQLPAYSAGTPYAAQIASTGGTPPHRYSFLTDYQHVESNSSYPPGNTFPIPIKYSRTRLAYIDLPFVFPFYGQQFTTLYVGDNGTINFDSLSYPYAYIRDGKAYLHDRFCIAGGYSMSGLYYRPEGDFIMAEVRDDHVLIEWHMVSPLTGDTIMPAVRLFPSGRIEIYRPPFTGSAPGSVFCGISAGDQCNNRLYSYDEADVQQNHCHVFVPLQPAPGFSITENGMLSFTPVADTTAYQLKVQVTDQQGLSAVKSFDLFNTLSATAIAAPQETNDTSFFLQLSIQNQSVVGFSNLTVEVEAIHPAVSILTGIATVDALAPGQQHTIQNTIRFSTNKNLGNNEAVSFRVKVTGGSLSQTLYTSLTINRPEVVLVGYRIDDGDNQRIDAGETTEMAVTLANVSPVGLNQLSWQLTSGSSWLTVADTSFTAPVELKAGQFGDHNFVLSASRDSEIGSSHQLYLTLNDVNGYQQRYPVTVTIGKTQVLIAEAAKKTNSADTLAKYLTEMKISFRRVKAAVVDFNSPAIFVLLGSQANSTNLTSEESGRYADYLKLGGNLYIEGFNHWHYGLRTRLNKFLKYTTTSSTISRFDSLNGAQDNFQAGSRIKMTKGSVIATYILSMLGNSRPLFESDVASPRTIVYSKDTTYKVIGSMAEVGNMTPVFPLTTRSLIGSYCGFLGLDTSGIHPLFHTLTRRVHEHDTVQFTDDSSEGTDAWQWEFAGGSPAVSALQHPEVVYNTAGNYPVKLTVWKNGVSRSITRNEYVKVSSTVGIETDTDNTENLSVIPNPALHSVLITTPFATGRVLLEWYSTDGKLLKSHWHNAGSTITASIKDLPSGMIILKVSQGGAKHHSTSILKL